MLETIGRKAKEASFLLGKTPTVKKNAALLAVADELNSRAEEILAANAKDIENADVVIIAADIKVGGKERFKGKKVVEVPTHIAIKSPKALLNKIEAELK